MFRRKNRDAQPAPAAPAKNYGLLARYETPEALVAAARMVQAAGYRRFDAYAPFPVEGLSEAMALKPSPVPWFVLAGGLAGAIGGFAMQTYATTMAYPLNIGGRPEFSWPLYIPISFELTILLGAFAGLGALILLAGLPQPYHPVFNVEDFRDHGSQEGFYLGIEAQDERFNLEDTRRLLSEAGAVQVSEIEA